MARAYQDTEVHWSKSQTKIVKLLEDNKIYQTRFTNMESRFALEFVANLPEQPKPVAIRLVVPFEYEGDNPKKREKELNRLHRVLFYHLKAKFVAIDSGLTEFMEEFMPHLIVQDNKGNSSTMSALLLPQYRKNLEEGGSDFNLLGDGK